MGNIIYFEDLQKRRRLPRQKPRQQKPKNLYFSMEFTRKEMAVLKKVFEYGIAPATRREDFVYILSYNIKALNKGLKEIEGVRNGKYRILLHAYEIFYFQESINHELERRNKQYGVRQKETLNNLNQRLDKCKEEYEEQVENFFKISFTDKYDVMTDVWGASGMKKGT